MRRGAFTLLEVVLCLALAAALAGGIVGFLLGLVSQREAIVQISSRQQGASALLEHIENDLAGGLVGDERVGAGVVGTPSSLVLLTRGVWMPRSAAPEGMIDDLQGAEYAFDRETGVVRARRWAGGEDEPDEPELICSGVRLARFRYFDGESWSGSFDSLRRGQLPVAVELAIWFGDAEGAGASGALRGGFGEGGAGLPSREPDRVRLMIVPDGPVTSWMEGR
jgi:type II secretory pathway pseudopilin PulG